MPANYCDTTEIVRISRLCNVANEESRHGDLRNEVRERAFPGIIVMPSCGPRRAAGA